MSARARLHAAVTRLLTVQRAPWVILLEDLHWAGSESMELLGHLAPALVEVPVLPSSSSTCAGKPKATCCS